MMDDFQDYDDLSYFCYKDWQPGTPETAYKIMAGFKCVLKRGMDHTTLYLTNRLLELMDENRLPGTGVPYTLFSVSYLHSIQYGIESDREKYSVARLEKWQEYLSHFREVTGLPVRMGTLEEVLVYAEKCYDVMAIHPIDWREIFATDGDGYVAVDVDSEQPRPVQPGDGVFADILLVCDQK